MGNSPTDLLWLKKLHLYVSNCVLPRDIISHETTCFKWTQKPVNSNNSKLIQPTLFKFVWGQKMKLIKVKRNEKKIFEKNSKGCVERKRERERDERQTWKRERERDERETWKREREREMKEKHERERERDERETWKRERERWKRDMKE